MTPDLQGLLVTFVSGFLFGMLTGGSYALGVIVGERKRR